MQTLERRLSRRIQRAAERRSCREHTRPRPRGGAEPCCTESRESMPCLTGCLSLFHAARYV
jgi:hypothetical protein